MFVPYLFEEESILIFQA